MKLALATLSLALYCSATALPPLPSVKGKPEVASLAAPAKPLQCVYADASKTGKKTIVCGDPAPPTLASLMQKTKPAAAVAADDGDDDDDDVDEPSQLQRSEARTFLEKCFGDKKKQEQVAVFVQQPEYQHYHHQPPVQYVQPPVQYVQPQVQYVQPQIQYVQPQVQLLQPQVHVVQQQPPQVHYVEAPPQVHYVKQHHYVHAPQVHYVQQHYPVKSLCQQEAYYARSADGYPVQLMRAVDAGPEQTVLMAVDDDGDDYDDDAVAARSSSADPTVAVVWSDEPTPVASARGALEDGARLVPSFNSIFRPAVYRAAPASEGVRYREYPADISADFQQQLSEQQQQVHDLSSSLQQYGSDFPVQQLSYGGGGGFLPSYGASRTVSRSGPADFRGGYAPRPAMQQPVVQMMRSNVVADGRRTDAFKSTSDEQNVRRPSPQQSSSGQMVADDVKGVVMADQVANTVVVADGNVPKNPVYQRQTLQ